MKNLIRKILKEEENGFEWVRDVEQNSNIEQEIKEGWVEVDSDYDTDMVVIFNMLIKHGFHEPEILKEMGHTIYDEIRDVYDRGVDSGAENCTCDGCCEDYVWYDDAEQEKREAREEGIEEGREDRQEEIDALRTKISELKEKISDLESRIEE